MKKSVWLLPLLALGLGLQSLVLAQGGARAANVRVALASIQSIAPETIVPGTVVSRSDARLAAEVTGRLMEVADVGTIAAKGDVVAKIEDTIILLRRQELLAEVERAQARQKYLESEESRYVKLAESNLAAATKLEETRSDRDVSRGDLRVAKSRLAQLEDQLSRTSIRAPFSGIVVERLMMPGERVDIGRNVVRMVDQQHLEVIARAPLEYYSYVLPGQELAVRTGNVVATGIVRTVVAVGSENTHQFELRLDIESGSFPVGQTLRVSVPTSFAREALVVPRDALVLRPGAISVFVVDNDQKAKQVMVTTGIGSGDQIEVSGDLSDGNTVIIRGNERLRSGQSVSIMEG
ncbi:MAG: efflux RND transporter periplasmic adaptor subunit [Xanthomonadales bacterium]|nr:efflux RND transporter periplasmic adaptor subunit [Xanthomonadales bacterium]